MADPAGASGSGASGSEAADAILAGILEGVPPDPDAAGRLGVDALTRVYRRVLAEPSGSGRERLAAIAHKDGGRVGDLAIEVLGKWGGPDAAELLASLEAPSVTPSRRKSLRRARHFCASIHGRSEGDEGPRPVAEVAASSAADSGADPSDDRTAWMTAPGMLGSRVWLFRRAARPGRLAVIAISDSRGIRDFTWQDGKDDAFSRYRARLAEHGHRVSPVPWDWLVGRLAEAELRNAARSEPLPPNWSVVRDWVGVDAAAARPPADHPALSRESAMPLGELPDPAQVTGLLELPETAEWILPPHAFEGREQELAEAGESQLVLEGLDPQARVQQVVASALDDYLATDEKVLWIDRLLDLALVLSTSERERAGQVAVFIADDLASAKRSPVADAFFWALAGRALGISPGDAGRAGAGEAPDLA